MKQIEVSIMGQSYLLGCPEGGEERLKEAVSRVDREMCAIRDSGKLYETGILDQPFTSGGEKPMPSRRHSSV